MKISDEIERELLKKNFKSWTINGLQNFVNSGENVGFELKNNHLNPYVVEGDEKIFNPAEIPEILEDAMVIFENLSGNQKKEHKQTIEKYVSEIAIVPKNLNAELIQNHPGTIACLLNMQQTDPAEIQTRKGPDGKLIKYVEGDYILRCLNYATLFDWDFELLESREDEIDGLLQFSENGKLTIRTTEGKTISKTQWGSQIRRTKMEVGDALKGAATDSLKKCASQFGIARDVYAE